MIRIRGDLHHALENFSVVSFVEITNKYSNDDIFQVATVTKLIVTIRPNDLVIFS